jgi:hypothetical protein
MEVIRIHERAEMPDGWSAVVSFNYGAEYPITVRNPFTEAEEQQLEWYFEQHPQSPFTRQAKAATAAASITFYGEALFKQVFEENSDLIYPYRSLVQQGLYSLQVEIAGSPKFHALHWEVLKDPRFHQPLAVQATILRKNMTPPPVQALIRPSPTINLLIVTARSADKEEVSYRTISRPLMETLRDKDVPTQIDMLRPGTYRALENHLRHSADTHGEGYYHLIHFDMHGIACSYAQLQEANLQRQKKGKTSFQFAQRYGRTDIQPYEGVRAFLYFDSEGDDQYDLLEATELANLLTKHRVPIIILNACQSGKQVGDSETSLGSHLMLAGVQQALAMGYSLNVRAAQLLMSTLYEVLFQSYDLSVAVRQARIELYNDKKRTALLEEEIDLEDWVLPVVYQNHAIKLSIRNFTPEERNAYYERKAEEQNYTYDAPRYGFVGRDRDILQIEKRLLTRRKILLIRGISSVGKTTLLKHLATWWSSTGFVQRVFYFGYDEKSWTLQQILIDIAQKLYGLRYYTDFQPLSLAAQQAMLIQSLRAQQNLLILDNLQSITEANFVIQPTLLQEERTALQGFLTRLVSGHTLIILGSRAGEDWLARGTFDNNVYDLPGLDAEAASTLANRIMLRYNVTKYREDENLQKLIKMLDGSPSALEVMLAKLARQSPTEILAALQAGDISIDRG